VVTAKLDLKKEKGIPSLLCIEPATISIQRIFSACALVRVGSQERDTTQPANTNTSANSVLQPRETDLTKATFLGLAEEVCEDLIDQIIFRNPQDTESPIDTYWDPRNKAPYNKLL
jgi:hypothetical protein